MACLEKYAWGMISPKKVIIPVEKTNAMIPAITEFDNNVRNTFIPTFPHNIVVRRKFESSLNFAIFNACLLFFLDSISSSNLLILKKARLRPENIAEWEIQNTIPIQINRFIFYSPFITFIFFLYSSFLYYFIEIGGDMTYN